MKTKLKLPDARKARRYFARKLSFTTGPMELSRWIKEGANVQVVDVRRPEDFEKGHVPGAVSLPKDKWHKAASLRKDKVNVFYCYSQVCHLAAAAALEFSSRGLPVMELEGGFNTWKEYGLPVEKRSRKAAAKPARRSHRPTPAAAVALETPAAPEEAQTQPA